MSSRANYRDQFTPEKAITDQFVGKTFGTVTVDRFVHTSARGNDLWWYKCLCGHQGPMRSRELLALTMEDGCHKENCRFRQEKKPPAGTERDTTLLAKACSNAKMDRYQFQDFLFTEKIEIKDSEDGSCWMWRGFVKEGRNQRIPLLGGILAYKLVFDIMNIPRPEKKHAHRTCGRPTCVNPDHIYFGTKPTHPEEVKPRKKRRFRWKPKAK